MCAFLIKITLSYNYDVTLSVLKESHKKFETCN